MTERKEMDRVEARPNDDGTWSLVQINQHGWVMAIIGKIYDKDSAELIAQMLTPAEEWVASA